MDEERKKGLIPAFFSGHRPSFAWLNANRDAEWKKKKKRREIKFNKSAVESETDYQNDIKFKAD